MNLTDLLEKFFNQRFKLWQNWPGRLIFSIVFSAAIISAAISINKLFDSNPIIDNYELITYIIVFILVSLSVFWITTTRYFPRTPKNHKGFLLILGVSEDEKDDDEIRFRKDVVETLSATFSKYQNNISFLAPCLQQSQVELESIDQNQRLKQIQKLSKADLIVSGRVKVRNASNKKHYVFNPLPSFHHNIGEKLQEKGFTLEQIATVEKQINSLFQNRTWKFDGDDQVLGVEITKKNLELSALYLLGFQLFILGNFTDAEITLKNVISDSNFTSTYTSHEQRIIKRHYSTASYIKAAELHEKGFERQNHLDIIHLLEPITKSIDPDFDSIYFPLARSYFLVEEFYKASELYIQLEQSNSSQMPAFYAGRAFLYAWDKDYNNAERMYKKLGDSNLLNEQLKFYHSIFNFVKFIGEKHNRKDLDYFIGQIAYFAGDYRNAKTYFNEFLENQNQNFPKRFYHKTKDLLKQIGNKA